jgi:hypothetical protein
MRTFLELFEPGRETSILDVGGTSAFWVDSGTALRVTILNVLPGPDHLPSNLTYVLGSATSLPFPDKSFDIVFSNSTIEHLRDQVNQEYFAREAIRVGRGVWVQTPARWFPIEPHLLTPFIHYLPKRAQRRLLRNFSVWGLIARPDQSSVDRFLDEIAPLTASDMRALFPSCELRRERVLGLTKSLIAVKTRL